MSSIKHVSKHLREAYFGDNWTAVNLKDALAGITWQEAVTKVYDLNTIAALVFHINYYVSAVLNVLQGEPLKASDKFSFNLEPINSANEWQALVTKAMTDAEQVALEIEKLDEAKLFEDFAEGKYGNYYRNLHGIIEHTYYHLGQILLLKKILKQTKEVNPDE